MFLIFTWSKSACATSQAFFRRIFRPSPSYFSNRIALLLNALHFPVIDISKKIQLDGFPQWCFFHLWLHSQAKISLIFPARLSTWDTVFLEEEQGGKQGGGGLCGWKACLMGKVSCASLLKDHLNPDPASSGTQQSPLIYTKPSTMPDDSSSSTTLPCSQLGHVTCAEIFVCTKLSGNSQL